MAFKGKMIQPVIDYINKQGGAITYSEYMNLVLYHPELGYYSNKEKKIGKDGDFYTASNVSDVFAKVFANLFARLVKSGAAEPFFCELGGGTGRFLSAMLREWEEISPETFKVMKVYSVEKSGYHRELQSASVKLNRLTSISSIDDLPKPYSGIIFSNELFDAFPVEVIEKSNNQLFEVCISFNQENELVEKRVPLKNDKIKDYLNWQGIKLCEGQRFEIPLSMLEYLEKINALAHKAVIVTIDYGYTNKEWQHPARYKGSMRGYLRHRMMTPLANPFEMDLTAHIHFDALEKRAAEFGWNLLKSERQDLFLANAGILSYLMENGDLNPFGEAAKQNRAIRSLIMPDGMSSSFQVFIHEKGTNLREKDIY
ncbi:class I SAM-dependent methyltransferase [Peribacillus frigoritolerans]|uniref:class I SAM-dependent methyltransferase n=1 Tax=Peribacillus frigoritolerans TaxID=450367 RepID=UPI00256FAA84|nr:SAM-dependent methyltransferase [Peribacillus frigoritolerans]